MMINIENIKRKLALKAIKGELTNQNFSFDAEDLYISIIIKRKQSNKKFKEVYSLYSNAPFDIPKNWKWCNLSNISSIVVGATPSTAIPSYWDNGTICWLPSGCCHDCVVTENNKYIKKITQLGFDNCSASMMAPGTTLLALTGATAGRVGYLTFNACANQSVVGISADCLIDSKFVYYSFYARKNKILNDCVGSAQPHISKDYVTKMVFPLPPLEEQKRIVAKLDVIFAELDKIDEKQIRLATIQEKMEAKILKLAIQGKIVEQKPEEGTGEELFKQIQQEKQELFKQGKIKKEKPLSAIEDNEIPFEIPATWKWVRLCEVCEIPITDGTHQTPKYSTKEDGIPFISSKDVTTKTINWTNIKYITKELHDELYRRIAPQKDDVLLAKNGTTGVAALVEDDRVFDIYVTLAVLRPFKNRIYPRFLLNVINSPICKSQFNEHLIGIGVPNLHLNVIKETLVPLPPLEEQKRIVAKIEELLPLCHSLK